MKTSRQIFLLFLLLCSPVSAGGESLIPVLSLLLNGCHMPAAAGWGSDVLSSADRPQQEWMRAFEAVTPIGVSTTIEEAINSCPAGEYCVVRVSGTLTLGDTVYLDRPRTKIVGDRGSIIRYADSVSNPGAFFEVGSDTSEIVLEGLNIDGNSKNYGNKDVYGVVLYGSSVNKVAVVDNEIHHLFSDNNAHGIAVFGVGGSEADSVQNIIIRGNSLHDLRTGSSETIAVNGNVKHWLVADNRITNINNIAIDAIGGEGTSPPRTVAGRVLPGEFDAARYGFIENNVITGMSTVSNVQYGSRHSWAAAVYVDGGHHIRVAGNKVSGSEWAYEVGAENCVKSEHVQIQDNLASGSYFGDFVVGGYAETGFEEDSSIGCDPLSSNDNDEGHGYVQYLSVACNEFITPSAPAPFVNGVETSFRIRRAFIVQDGVSAEHTDGVVSGDQNSIRVSTL